MLFDDLYLEIGEIGRYQMLVVHLGCWSSFWNGLTFLSTYFVLAVPDHRCAIPGLENDTFAVQDAWHKSLINQTIPLSDDKDFVYDQCNIFKRSADGGFWKEECSNWVYDKSDFDSTLAAELDMVCDRAIMKSNVQMMFFGGLIFGSIVTGMFSDRFGRKPTLCLSSLFYFISYLAIAWTPNFAFVAAMTFLFGFFAVGNFMTAFVNGVEFVGSSSRRFAGTLGGFYWCGGSLLLALLGYLIRDWKTLQIVTALPGLVFQLFWFIFPESPRWLFVAGHKKRARVILDRIAKSNNKVLTDKIYESVEVEEEKVTEDRIWHIFMHKRTCIRTLIMFMNWIAVCMASFGLALNSADLGGDLFLGFFLQAIVDLPAKISMVILLDRTGRKFLMISTMILGGLGCIATVFTTLYGGDDFVILNTILALVGKFGATAGYTLVYIYGAELFPTTIRNAGMGACSCASRIGGMLSPYVADLDRLIPTQFGKVLPMIMFGTLSLIGGSLSFYLPETLNVPLPETIEEGERIGSQPEKNVDALENGYNKGKPSLLDIKHRKPLESNYM